MEALHYFDSRQTHHGYIEAHVLIGLTHLNNRQVLAPGNAGRALDDFVRSFHGFDSYAGAVADDHRLP